MGLLTTATNNQNDTDKAPKPICLYKNKEEDKNLKPIMSPKPISPTTLNLTSDRTCYNNMINWSNHSNSDHQTYAGYLKKQGALFKQWKERYFVLDSVKHQVIFLVNIKYFLLYNLDDNIL